MSCPAITNKGGKLSISRFPVACELTLPELALLDYAVVPGVGSIGDTGIEQEISSYSTVNAGMSPQSKAAAVGKAWDVEMIESQSDARDVFDTASAVGNKDTYATRIEWPDGAVEFSIVQVSSPTYVKGAPSGVRIVRYTMIPSFLPIVTNALPVASNVVVTGAGFVGSTLVATYDYYSPLGLPESGSTYQWYADGVAIPGATSLTYVATLADAGSEISFSVFPSDGLSDGARAESDQSISIANVRFNADATDLYTDTALTVPVTSYGDAVAGWRGAGLVGVQPTLTARPAYGRMPEVGVRNLFPALSDDRAVTNGGQFGPGAAFQVNTYSGYDSLLCLTGGLFGVEYAVGSPGIWYAIRFQARKLAGSGWFRDPEVSGVALRAEDYLVYDLGSESSDWVDCVLIGTPPNSTRINYRLVWDAVPGLEIALRNIQVELVEPNTTGPTAYQSVGAGPYDVTESGVPDTPILYYDLGDDVLPAAMALPSVTGGTLVIAGEKGIWVDDSFNHAGGSWSLGPTTYTGGAAALLPNLVGNRVLGFSVFAGQLTPAELQAEVTDWMARGAPGVWNADGTDELDGASFNEQGGNEFALASGVATITRAVGGVEIIAALNGTLPENIWLFSGSVTVYASRPAAVYQSNTPLVEKAAGSDGNLGFVFQGDFSNNLQFRIRGANPSVPVTQTWEGLSLRTLTLNTDPYP